jgi:hypothetical protein
VTAARLAIENRTAGAARAGLRRSRRRGGRRALGSNWHAPCTEFRA